MAISSDSGDEQIVVKVDPDLIDIIPQFLENVTEDIAAIERAVAGRDFETARILGHSLKGSGAGYGFDLLSDCGRAVESASVAGDASLVGEQLAKARAYLAAVVVVSDG